MISTSMIGERVSTNNFQSALKNLFSSLTSPSQINQRGLHEFQIPLFTTQPSSDTNAEDRTITKQQDQGLFLHELDGIPGVFIRRKAKGKLYNPLISHNIYPITQDRDQLKGKALFKSKEVSHCPNLSQAPHLVNIVYQKEANTPNSELDPFLFVQKINSPDCTCQERFPWTVMLNQGDQKSIIGNIIKDNESFGSRFSILDSCTTVKYVIDGSCIFTEDGIKVGTVTLAPESSGYCKGKALDFEINFPVTSNSIEKILIIVAAIIRVYD